MEMPTTGPATAVPVAGTSMQMQMPLVRDGAAVRYDDRVGLDQEYQREWKERVHGAMSHYRRSVWKYKAESVVGPRVLIISLRSHWIQTRKSTIVDVFVLSIIFAVALVTFYYSPPLSDGQATRLKDLTTDFHGLCTFLLGFYLNTCLSRWWAIRADGIGGLWGNMDDISLLLSTFFPSNSEADEAVRDRVLRWGVLSHELIYKQVMGTSDELLDLMHRGLLLEEERQILQPLAAQELCSLPQVVWSWQVSFIAHLAYGDPAKGGSRLPYPYTVMPQLHALCLKARDAIGLLFTYTDTQVPLRYLTLMSSIVWIHNIIQCINSAAIISRGLHGQDYAVILVEGIFLCVYPMVYLSVLHVGANMLCPLKDKNDVDLPHGAFSYWMLRENRSFFDGTCAPRGPPHGEAPVWKGDARPAFS